MISKEAKIIFLGVFVAAIVGGMVVHKKVKEWTPASPPPHRSSKPVPTTLPSSQQPSIPTPPPPLEQPPPTKPPAAKTTTMLHVPFTAQAPTGNWDELHNEACEEASAIMVAAYFSGDTRSVLPAAEVEKQITELTNWEEGHFGYSLDTTAAETAEMIRSVYHLKATIVNDFTESDIKQALMDNKLVIIPVDGRRIGNPYYRQPGPIYHMLVIRGYTKTDLVTNDPGTRRGENFAYSFSTLKDATVDWNHVTDTIDDTQSLMIVVSK